MRKSLLLPLLVIIVSCGTQNECERCGVNYVSIAVSGLPAEGTKASIVTPEDEGRVSSCRLYVFDNDGNPVDDGVYDVDPSTRQTGFYLKSGTYSFYAFANLDALPSAPKDAEELLSVTNLLEDNSVGDFVMGGKLKDVQISSDVELNVKLERFVSKFSYVVRNKAKDESTVLKVEKIYLTNVVGSNDLSGTTVPDSEGKWFNKLKYEHFSDALDSLLLIPENDLRAYIDCGDTLSTSHFLYAYPNNRPNIYGSSSWSARNTRFVIEGEFGDRHWYYPVAIPSVERNRHYHIDVTVTGPGVEDPEDPVGGNAFVKVLITVAPWNDGGTIEQVF